MIAKRPDTQNEACVAAKTWGASGGSTAVGTSTSVGVLVSNSVGRVKRRAFAVWSPAMLFSRKAAGPFPYDPYGRRAIGLRFAPCVTPRQRLGHGGRFCFYFPALLLFLTVGNRSQLQAAKKTLATSRCPYALFLLALTKARSASLAPAQMETRATSLSSSARTGRRVLAAPL